MHQNCKFNYITFILVIILARSLWSQVGIGAVGVYRYPGLQSSSQYDIHFNGGIGYGFYVKHDLLKFSGQTIYLRYLAIISNHTANLPGIVSASTDSDYRFSNLSVDVMYEFVVKDHNKYYTGVSVSLLRTLSEGKFRATYTGSSVYPSVFAGWEHSLADGFDSFAELKLDYGKTDADGGPEEIPITGVSLLLGITMYISK